ncbi:hypothetical protein [Bradyrhizobium embrapense]
MRAEQEFKRAALAFSLVALLLLPTETSAITVEVARKCNALVAKNFPPRQPGNPAAGSAKGNGQAERDYFKKCVDNGGNADDAADKDKK